MIEKRWLDSLNDPDPEIRKQAVRAITNSGDETAMTHLAKVYRTDHDPEVREMARQGGIKLRQMGYTVHSAEPEPDRYEDEYDPMADLYATPLREERPPVRQTPSNPILEKPKYNNSDTSMSWSTVAPDLFLYFVIVTVGTFIVTSVLLESMRPLIDDIFEQSSPQELAEIRELIEGSTGTMLVSAVISGVLAVLTLMLQTWIIHYMATASFGGYGNMFAFLRKYAIASALLTVVIFGLSTFFLVTTFAAIPDLSSTTTATTTTISDSYASTVIMMCCGILIGIIGVFWYFGRMISTHYMIGTWSAIGAFIAAGIAAQITIQVLSNFLFSII